VFALWFGVIKTKSTDRRQNMRLDETYLIDGVVASHPSEITDEQARELLDRVPVALFEAWNNATTHERAVKAADEIIAAAVES
jgi:hypothetical protein